MLHPKFSDNGRRSGGRGVTDRPRMSASHPPRKAPIIPPGMKREVVRERRNVMTRSETSP